MKTRFFPTSGITALALASCALPMLALPAAAATNTWNGTVGQNWNSATGWSDGIPTSDDDVIMANPSSNGGLTINSTVSVNSVLLSNNNTNSALLIATGGSLAVASGNITNNGALGARITIQQSNATVADSILTADITTKSLRCGRVQVAPPPAATTDSISMATSPSAAIRRSPSPPRATPPPPATTRW